MDEQVELLREICELLRVLAEPALAQRDEVRRTALRDIVGKSSKRIAAVYLMDGLRTQGGIRKEMGIDQGDLSRFVKALKEKDLVRDTDKPKLTIKIPDDFWQTNNTGKK